MADIKVRIELNAGKESDLITPVINNIGNVSNGSFKTDNNRVFIGLDNEDGNGRNLLSFANGALKFESNGYLSSDGSSIGMLVDESNPDMFIWGAVPSNGEYLVELSFSNAENLTGVVVYGDNISSQFPIEAIVDGVTTIYNDNYRWKIDFDGMSSKHTIQFTKWNRVNYSACLTYIAAMAKYFFADKKTGLRSIESLSQSTGQPREIFYGVIPNSGTLEIVDVDGSILEMINSDTISNSDLKVDIFANNKKVQSHISDDSDYYNPNLFSLQVSNKLSNLENLTYGGFKNENVSKTLYDILVDGLSVIGYTDYKYIDDFILGEDNANYLKAIIYPSPYVPVMNFKEFINKICEMGQMSLTESDEGELKFVNLRPSEKSSKNIVVIPQKMQQSVPSKNVILKNKVERVEYVNSNFKKEIGKAVNTYVNDNVYIKPYTDNIVPVYDYDYYFFSGQSMGQTLTQGVRIETFVTNGTFEIVDQSIESIDNFDFSLSGKVYTLPVFLGDNFSKSYWDRSGNSLISDRDVSFDKDEYTSFSGTLEDVSYTFQRLEDYENKTLKLQHKNNISFTKLEDGRWKVDYSILTSTAKYYMYGTNVYINDKFGEFKTAETLTISANGSQWRISFVDNVNRVGDESSQNYKSLPKNELLQDNVHYNGMKIGDVISNNILMQYRNGLSNADITVICGNYFNENGELLKNWSSGEIIQVGDIVRLDKNNIGTPLWRYANGDNMYFMVTGRNFRYSGVPIIDLQLQEVKLV